MTEKFRTLSAVMLMLTREGEKGEEVLFQKRKNTGYCDGFYDFSASGHVENHESMKQAMCREAKEEVGIEIQPEDLEFVCMIHKNNQDTGTIYYNGFFKAKKWKNEPCINEPEKNEELRWIPVNELPENVVDDRKVAIKNYQNGIFYSEMGW